MVTPETHHKNKGLGIPGKCAQHAVLYSEKSTPHVRKQEHRLHAFHMRCLRPWLIEVTWKEHMTSRLVC